MKYLLFEILFSIRVVHRVLLSLMLQDTYANWRSVNRGGNKMVEKLLLRKYCNYL